MNLLLSSQVLSSTEKMLTVRVSDKHDIYDRSSKTGLNDTIFYFYFLTFSVSPIIFIIKLKTEFRNDKY